MKNICVFCGSSPGVRPAYAAAAREVGQLIARQGWHLVYGGGSIGLMGIVADAVMAGGGKATGVIPQFLDDMEVGHKGLTELVIVESMHERKQLMSDLCDGVITLPGGMGTLEELAEIQTWAQLGQVRKPIGLLNVEGYYDPLLAMMDRMVSEGFLKEKNRKLLVDDPTVAGLVAKMEAWQPDGRPQTMTRDQN